MYLCLGNCLIRFLLVVNALFNSNTEFLTANNGSRCTENWLFCWYLPEVGFGKKRLSKLRRGLGCGSKWPGVLLGHLCQGKVLLLKWAKPAKCHEFCTLYLAADCLCSNRKSEWCVNAVTPKCVRSEQSLLLLQFSAQLSLRAYLLFWEVSVMSADLHSKWEYQVPAILPN